MNGDPSEAVMVCHSYGWMQTEIICSVWFRHCLKSVKPTDDDQVVSIFDARATHTKNSTVKARAH
jgi:hypothetical protein